MEAVSVPITTTTAAIKGTRKSTMTNFFSLSLLQLGNYVLPMLSLPIISRVIGPENYGLINYAFAFVGYFVLFINAGFDLYGTRQVVDNRDRPEVISKVFSSIILSKAVLLLISTAVFVATIYLVPQLKDQKALGWFTFLVCIGWVINPSWLFHGMQESKNYAFFSFISKLLFTILVLVLIRQREDYILQPLMFSLAHILISVVSFYYGLKKYRIRIKTISLKEVRTTLHENFKLSLIWWISNQAVSTNIVVGGLFLSALDLGYFSAAFRIIVIIQSIVAMPLNMVMFPYIGEAFKENADIGFGRLHKAIPYIIVIALGMSVVTFLFAHFIITGFYGKEFAPAVNLLQIGSIVLFFSTLNTAFGQQVLLNTKADNLYMKLVVAGFVLNIVFLLFFVINYKAVGAMWAWPIAEAIIFISYFSYFKWNSIKVVNYAYMHPQFLVSNLGVLIKRKEGKLT